jgi:hypothetical protein
MTRKAAPESFRYAWNDSNAKFGQESSFPMRCMELPKRLFSVDTAVRQIVRALSGGSAVEPAEHGAAAVTSL